MQPSRAALLACVAAVLSSVPAVPSTLPAQARPGQPAPGDSATVAQTVERFHRALAEGDSAGALALLAADVVIQESGGQESWAEYRAHHLPADIEFARAVRSRQGPVRVRVRGDVAWATSTSTAQGRFRGRAVDSEGVEMMVLTREHGGWRIAAIHWSSHARR
jgi:ketosteroid isomerase-like protein